jgi:ribulose-phosphate 3-epimerase
MLASNLADISGELQGIAASGVNIVHWDVMDGHFVPNLTFGPGLIRLARQACTLEFDVHLMVERPEDFVGPLAECGIGLCSFQVEATRFAPRLCRLIREHGMRPSAALNPQTPLASLDHIIELVDNVLIMTVDPGFGGQAFIEASWSKLAALRDLRAARGLGFTIEADGGVGPGSLARLAEHGVDIAVAGTAYFGAGDRAGLVQAALDLG